VAGLTHWVECPCGLVSLSFELLLVFVGGQETELRERIGLTHWVERPIYTVLYCGTRDFTMQTNLNL